jgi:hypothetical protein
MVGRAGIVVCYVKKTHHIHCLASRRAADRGARQPADSDAALGGIGA